MIANKSTFLFFLAFLASTTSAWVVSTTTTQQGSRSSSTTTALKSSVVSTRDEFLKTAMAVAVGGSTLLSSSMPAFAEEQLPNGVTYTVKKSGSGQKPVVGDLVALRFAAYVGQNKIDDLFDNPEPYYTRVGSGGLIKGVEETLPLMRVGDRWELTVPGKLAFGPKGRPASAGKPRIPGDATVVFDVEMEGLPGKEPELIDLIGDD